MRRIGAYGGTFDPIHNAHIRVARAVVRAFHLDELLLIPAYVPPHKEARSVTNSYHRYAMTVLAAMDDAAIKVSGIELETPDRPYTFQTIESLRNVYGPEAILFFVLGADSFEELSTWRKPERVLADANLIVATRPGHSVEAADLAAEFRDRIRTGPAEKEGTQVVDEKSGLVYVTDLVNVDISSTEIRRRARDGQSIDELVPIGVARYIQKYELYRR